jgi:hypothetical protein
MRATVTRIVLRKLTIGRCRTAILAGLASATATGGDEPPSAAKATAGKAMQAIKAAMKYVRFVSKRETVPVFAGPERDRAHTTARMKGILQPSYLKNNPFLLKTTRVSRGHFQPRGDR